MWFLILLFLTLFVYFLYKIGTDRFYLEKRYRILGPKPVPFLGNLLGIVKNGIHKYEKMCVSEFGPIYSFYSGRCPVIMVTDEGLMEEILFTKSKYFVDRMELHGFGKVMQKSLLRLQGEDWKRVRASVMSNFTSQNLKNLVPNIIKIADKILSDHLQGKEVSESIDVKKLFSEISISIITKSVLGLNLEDDACLREQFLFHSQRLVTIPFKNIWFLMLNIFPESSTFIDWLHPEGIVAKGSIQFFEDQIQKRLLKVEEGDQDFLSLMINGNYTKSKGEVTLEEIKPQIILLILAGFETTASTMSFLCYLLSNNMKAQDEVYEDIMSNINDLDTISYEDFSKCPILESAICETLRLYPPIDKTFRQCNADVSLKCSDGQILNIKAGTAFGIPFHIIHNEQTTWLNPEKFDLHRWNLSQPNKRYLPFGLGPRNCVGKRLGLMEIRAVMILILSKNRLRMAPECPTTISFITTGLNLLNNLEEAIKIDFIPRK